MKHCSLATLMARLTKILNKLILVYCVHNIIVYTGYHGYIDDVLPPESPYLYGLHPNAEIDFLTTTSDNLFRTILEMMPRDTGRGAGAGPSRDEKVGSLSHQILHTVFELATLVQTTSNGHIPSVKYPSTTYLPNPAIQTNLNLQPNARHRLEAD